MRNSTFEIFVLLSSTSSHFIRELKSSPQEAWRRPCCELNDDGRDEYADADAVIFRKNALGCDV